MGALSRALTLALSIGLVGCTAKTLPAITDVASAPGSAQVAPVTAAQPQAASQTPVAPEYGWLNLSIRWPEQTGYNVSLLPTTTNAIVVQINNGTTQWHEPLVISRKAGATSATASIHVEAATNLSVDIKAYRETAPDLANDQPIAQKAGVVNVVRSKVTPLTLVLDPLNVPTVSLFSQNLGRPGDTITVTGTKFGSGNVPVPAVTFNGTPATSVTRNSETSLTVAVPAGATSGYVQVKADGVDSNSFAAFWVLGDFLVSQPLKETWDTGTAPTVRQVRYGATVQFTERHNWMLKDGETAGQFGTPPALTWSLSESAAGSVDADGRYTAATAHATASLTAQLGPIVSNAIEVRAVGVDSVTLSQTSLTLNALPPDGVPDVGFVTSAQLTATVNGSGPFDRGGVVWESSDTSRVTVRDGLVATVANAAEGQVIITASASEDRTKQATASVTVTRQGDLELGIE